MQTHKYVQKIYKSDFCIIGLKLTGALPISSCTVHSLYCMKLCYQLSPGSENHTLHYLLLHSPLCFCTSFPTSLFSYICYMRTSTLDSDFLSAFLFHICRILSLFSCPWNFCLNFGPWACCFRCVCLLCATSWIAHGASPWTLTCAFTSSDWRVSCTVILSVRFRMSCNLCDLSWIHATIRSLMCSSRHFDTM